MTIFAASYIFNRQTEACQMRAFFTLARLLQYNGNCRNPVWRLNNLPTAYWYVRRRVSAELPSFKPSDKMPKIVFNYGNRINFCKTNNEFARNSRTHR